MIGNYIYDYNKKVFDKSNFGYKLNVLNMLILKHRY